MQNPKNTYAFQYMHDAFGAKYNDYARHLPSPPSPLALAVLHRQGDMTDAEFAAAKQRLLRERAGSDPRAYRRCPARDAA